MNWLNIELPTLRAEEYLGSDPTQRATWLNLLAYCADQENGGVIKDCREWGSRRWLQLLGVTKEEVSSETKLWSWTGNSLRVWRYPKAKELEVKQKRENGRKGGRPPKTEDNKPDGSCSDKPDGSEVLKRKGKEGKGKEVEWKEKEVEGKDADLSSLPAFAVELTDVLISHVTSLNPSAKNITSQLNETRFNWATGFDRIHRLDGKNPDEMRRVLHYAMRDSFWRTNILSADKFRKQYDTLFIKHKGSQSTARGL